MLRDVGAVIAGFITMAVIVMVGTMAMMAVFVPGGLAAMKGMQDGTVAMPTPTPRYYAMNIALSLVAAVIGGWVTARIAQPAPRGALAALGFVVIAMGFVSARGSRSASQPQWYKLVIPLIGAAGVAIAAAITT